MPLKVLVVDDDAPTVDLIREVLGSLGAEVRSVGEGEEAAILINQEKFDGIFLDLMMRQVDGMELARTIRRSSLNSHTPIIVVGKDDRRAMLQAFEAGGNFYLSRPIDKLKLTALLSDAHGALLEMLEERRRFKRIPVQTEVTCLLDSGTVTGMTANLSVDGILFQGDGSLQPGNEVQLSFHLPSPQTRSP